MGRMVSVHNEAVCWAAVVCGVMACVVGIAIMPLCWAISKIPDGSELDR